MNNVDRTLAKDFRFTESAKLQFRFSVFNLLNHPVFSGPTTLSAMPRSALFPARRTTAGSWKSEQKSCSDALIVTLLARGLLEKEQVGLTTSIPWSRGLRSGAWGVWSWKPGKRGLLVT